MRNLSSKMGASAKKLAIKWAISLNDEKNPDLRGRVHQVKHW